MHVFGIVDTRRVYDRVFDIYVPIAIGVFVVFTAAIVIATVRNRAHSPEPIPVRRWNEANLLEGIYVVTLTAVAALLLYVSFRAEHQEDTVAAHERPAVTIDATGVRWEWYFRYAGRQIRRESGVVGHEIVVVPENEPVRFKLRSADVIHSFWIPQLGYKRDLIPGTVESITLDFDHAGMYGGSCAEFCGLLHAEMVFTVEAIPDTRFRRWLASDGRAAT